MPANRPICTRCGSDNVRASATVTWDDENQMWEMDGHIHSPFCRTCGTYTALRLPDGVNGSAFNHVQRVEKRP